MTPELRVEINAWLRSADYAYADDRKLIRKLIAALEEADAVADAVKWCQMQRATVAFLDNLGASRVNIWSNGKRRYAADLAAAVAALQERLEGGA